MKVHFILRYHTRIGENCLISFGQESPQLLTYLNEDLWHGVFEIDTKKYPTLFYQFHFQAKNGALTSEWETERLLDLSDKSMDYQEVIDHWNPAGAIENTFLTQPFQNIFNPATAAAPTPVGKQTFSHVFKVKAPLVQAGQSVCLLGHGAALRAWDTAAPLVLKRDGNWWTIRLDLTQEDFPLGYKYGIWDHTGNRFLGFETGNNRTLYAPSAGQKKHLITLHDGFMRMPNNTWKGAGVAIPVFSLRSKKSWGVGEFTDLPLLADWAKSVGLKMIQLLPINDTTATHTWTDSYPYSAISAFALHPIFLNVEQLAGKKHAALLKPYLKQQKALNALEAVDYEAVLQMKWDIIRQLYDLLKADWLERQGLCRLLCRQQGLAGPVRRFLPAARRERHRRFQPVVIAFGVQRQSRRKTPGARFRTVRPDRAAPFCTVATPPATESRYRLLPSKRIGCER